jgi:hypothetical protein
MSSNPRPDLPSADVSKEGAFVRLALIRARSPRCAPGEESLAGQALAVRWQRPEVEAHYMRLKDGRSFRFLDVTN